MTTRVFRPFSGLVLCGLLGSLGCSFDNYQGRGTAMGALGGAAIGTAIGEHNDNPLLGAALGAVGGAALGSAVGDGIDRDIQQAQYQATAQQQAASQYAIDQVARMSQQGISDEVIRNFIRTNGMPRSPSAEEILYLKQMGASDPVITELQNAAAINMQPLPPQGTVVIEQVHHVGPPIFVRPRVPVRHVGPLPYRRRGRW